MSMGVIMEEIDLGTIPLALNSLIFQMDIISHCWLFESVFPMMNHSGYYYFYYFFAEMLLSGTMTKQCRV
jgi:hypothetical protein